MLYFSDRFSHDAHYYLESAFYFPFVTARSLPGFGQQLKHAMRDYGRFACALTLVHDEPEPRNRIVLHGRKARLDYRLSARSRHALVHAQRNAGRLFFAAGAERYLSPLSDRFGLEREAELDLAIAEQGLQSGRVVVSSAHPMGGCRMGSHPTYSVADGYGRVHGHPSLRVADASLFPESSKVNPYLTIMALADHVAEGLLSQLS